MTIVEKINDWYQTAKFTVKYRKNFPVSKFELCLTCLPYQIRNPTFDKCYGMEVRWKIQKYFWPYYVTDDRKNLYNNKKLIDHWLNDNKINYTLFNIGWNGFNYCFRNEEDAFAFILRWI